MCTNWRDVTVQLKSDDRMMVRIPVALARRPGYEDDIESYISPVIDIELDGVNISSSGICDAGSRVVKIKALVDTGCDEFYVDEDVLAQVGAQCLGVNALKTITIHGESMEYKYVVLLSIPGTGIKFRTSVLGRRFPGSERAYKAIIGMEFIRFGRLVIDASGESYLELPS